MRCWAEINLENLKYNIEVLKTITDLEKLMGVIKADAYGHGLENILKALLKNGLKWIGVATFDEAEKVRKIDRDVNVLILGPLEKENMKKAARLNVIFLLTSFDEIDYIKKEQIKCRVHIKVDTGMGRVGFSMDDFEKALSITEKYNEIISVEGIFSHLSSADTDSKYTNWQIENFKELAKKYPDIKYKHILNSFGSINHSDFYDIIRTGIILYGGVKPENTSPYKFKPVMSLKAKISFVKTLEKNSYISYNKTYEGKKAEKIATVSIGYADGVRRDLSNKGEVFANGQKCKMVGNVCMDQLMISVPEDLELKVGDTVEIFGDNIHIEDVAEKCNTISYEIMCGISSRVPRIYKGE